MRWRLKLSALQLQLQRSHFKPKILQYQISLTFNPIKSSTVLSPFLLQSDNWAIIFSTNIKHLTSEVKFLKLIRYSIDRSGHYWKDKRISDNLMILSDLSDSTVWPPPFSLLTTVSNLRLAGEKYSSQYFPTQSVSGNSIQCSDIWCLLHSICCFKIFLAVQDSSIGDLVTQSISESVRLLISAT